MNIIVDGYNTIFKIPALASMADQSLQVAREALADLLLTRQVIGGRRSKPVIVFDSRDKAILGHSVTTVKGIKCIFVDDADGHIIKMVKDARDSSSLLVVSADNRVRNSCKANAARYMDPSYLLKKRSTKTEDSSCDKDLDAETMDKITETMREVWGLT
ncbi:MAG: NYN domain-containing protein [Candidatus Omnitrophota bacterium]